MELQEYIVVDDDDEEEEGGAPLPGFRFHPTDEELVSFYLKRKVEKKPFTFELIKQIDIYTYDPWDLPKVGSSVGEKEWYFYCKRGRKYKNSMRPNRVTRSGGFWKATGIDRPIYDTNVVAGPRGIVGLKKSLVYYRGTAGKGAKTDWMMHEFRLPSQSLSGSSTNPTNSHLPEPEIWTLCRILKRSRKYTTPELSSKRGSNNITTNNLSTSAQSTNTKERYISFTTPPTTTTQPHYYNPDHGIKLVRRQSEEEQMIVENKNNANANANPNPNPNPNPYHGIKGQWASPILLDHELASNFSSPLNTTASVYDQDQCDYDGNYWDDLSSVVRRVCY